MKQSIHDLHNYSAVQCNFKRRESKHPVVATTQPSTDQNGNYKTAKKEKAISSNNDFAGPTSKSNEKKKPVKETQAALFFGGKNSKGKMFRT